MVIRNTNNTATYSNLLYNNTFTKVFTIISTTLLSFCLFAGLILTSSTSSADVVDDVSITVPVACGINDTLDTPHTATINPGTIVEDIGTTTFKVFCNDNTGYALYAIGYSNEEYGNTNLLPTNTSNPGIATGLATSGNTSSWAMKLTPVTEQSSGTVQPYVPTIESGPSIPGDPTSTPTSYSDYHIVPDIYTKVATFTSTTDFTIGSSLTSTYRAYIQGKQPADTYNGKVKYTLVHPNDANPPYDPRFVATLDTGQTVNQKLKRLAGNSSADYTTDDNTITALARANTLPAGFTPTADNTISTSSSTQPIYAWYDSASTTIYYYSDATDIKMNQDSSYFFNNMYALSDLSTISSWDTSSVTNMSYMFWYAGRSATTFTLDLSSWTTASVTNMSDMFYYAGSNATAWSVGNLSSWNTSSVTNMSYMFANAGSNATTWSVGDLSSWNTANVTNMSDMFSYAGSNATTWSVGDLSSWNTASVTNLSNMLSSVGRNATTWSVGDLSSWNTASVTNMSGMFYRAGEKATTFTLDLSSWNTASVTNMSFMFSNAGSNATTWSVGDLSSWNTASVTDMSSMFSNAGSNVTTWSVGDISSWNTASVTNMSSMFRTAGYNANTFTLDLSSWNTASVTSMSSMFYYAGYNATTFTLDLSSWNTASVTNNMSSMFYDAGRSATTWSVTISRTNGAATSPITNTTSNLYGNTTSVTATPPSGRSFTLAN